MTAPGIGIYPPLAPARRPLRGAETTLANGLGRPDAHVVAIYTRWYANRQHRAGLRVWLVLALFAPPALELLDKLEAELEQRVAREVELDVLRVGLRDRAPLGAAGVCIWTPPRTVVEEARFVEALLRSS